VPQQYTLVRTPARGFFPEALYGELEEALLEYGQQVLGCRSLTHVWLSYYVHGMGQQLHGDVPHGPWAFVLSLTHWDRRRFDGGETTIMRPQVADLWRSLDATRGMEYDDVMLTVPPLFNQLTVFDPRLPHGVRRVHGTSDPRYGAAALNPLLIQAPLYPSLSRLEPLRLWSFLTHARLFPPGRLVVHGWFKEPAVFFTGALQPEVRVGRSASHSLTHRPLAPCVAPAHLTPQPRRRRRTHSTPHWTVCMSGWTHWGPRLAR